MEKTEVSKQDFPITKNTSAVCRCEAVPCGNGSQLLHEGECRDPLGSGVCGGRRGARLYLGEDGRAECGCLEVSSQQPASL